MRITGLSILLLLYGTQVLATSNDAEVAYEAEQYEVALEHYLAINEQMTSAGLLYNIGNCYFKQDQLAESILYYERAKLLAPTDEDIENNLKFAQQQVIDRIKPLPTLQLGSYWEQFKAGSDINYWARISLFTCLLAFALLTALFYTSGIGRKVVMALMVLLFVITAISTALAANRKNDLLRGSEAIIMSTKVDIKSAPTENSTDLFLLHEGTKVVRLRDKDGWSEVRLANGKVGWMPQESLEVI